MKILFLCTGNSCRSILAEAVFNHLAPEGFTATSAGSKPVGTIHPRSLALLQQKSISTKNLASKSWDNLSTNPDIVITVCGNAANEICPPGIADAISSHWGVDDPATVNGSDTEIDAAFSQAYAILRKRIEAFFRLEAGIFRSDSENLKQALDNVGKLI